MKAALTLTAFILLAACASESKRSATQVHTHTDEAVHSEPFVFVMPDKMEDLDDKRPLKIGDKISIKILEDGDRSQSLHVQDSGDIQTPHIGLTQVAGQTCKAVAYDVKSKLEKQFFKKATVLIALERGVEMGPEKIRCPGLPGPPCFTIFGQVCRQGKYEIAKDEKITISQAILRAGGFTPSPILTKVKIIRKTPKGNTTIFINISDIMERSELNKDILIKAGDVIIIQEKHIEI